MGFKTIRESRRKGEREKYKKANEFFVSELIENVFGIDVTCDSDIHLTQLSQRLTYATH